MSFKASAPGSLMLFGEYAVLHGKSAIVCAIDKRISVLLTPRSDSLITITSDLGYLETNLSRLKMAAPFQFILAVLIHFRKKMKYGCDIKIVSEFSDKIGFASSAAVTVAAVKAVSAWLKISLPKLECVRTARAIVRSVQGMGSGADVAACVFGGIISYQPQPLKIEMLASAYPITVMYSGNKTPTPEAVRIVQENFKRQPKLLKQIYQAIGECALQAKHAIKKNNWMEAGRLMNMQQGLMCALGVNTPALDHLVAQLKNENNILGVKISGSGLGDCVVGLGNVSLPSLSVAIAEEGVYCEKN